MELARADKLIRKELDQNINQTFVEFLETFTRGGKRIYRDKVEALIQKGGHLLVISFGDLMGFSTHLWDTIVSKYSEYEPKINKCLTNYIHEIQKNIRIQNQRSEIGDRDIEEYYVAFENMHGENLVDLKCSKLGKLVAFKGTVTRTAEVRPELKKGVFKCLGCQVPSQEIEQMFKYTEPKKCRTANCALNRWELLPRLSSFNDFQKIRIQDDPSELAQGGMPRSMEVILRNQLCESAQPGDNCTFTGMLCVVPEVGSLLSPGQRAQLMAKTLFEDKGGNSIGLQGVTGLKQTGVRDLNYKLVFIATHVKVENQQFKHQVDEDEGEDILESGEEYSETNEIRRIMNLFPKSTQDKIFQMMDNPHKYQALAESLFPSIYGHIEIKKAILLQLFSGVHKITTTNKISIRGDINILIVGDPSTSKSMFLKGVETFVPRAVYTNGKTTSAAGLTATVTRDQNGDVGLEAGALMLADNGVCCIDEFDKMDIRDQVAIHEAMEQQTISIAKAGIYATLNARTSILAAANPVFGRYDKSKALKHNISMSAPIMSRFDLFFVVCDEPDPLHDAHIGEFILSMHKNQDSAIERVYESHEVRDYIRFARKLKPRMTVQTAAILRKCYIQLRQKEKDNFSSYRVTVRQLESMIRLSEALARLNLSLWVLPEHVQEAYRLISICIVKLEKSDVDMEEEEIDLAQKFGDIKAGQEVMEGENLVQKQMRDNKAEKKRIHLSYEVYMQFQRNIIQLYKEKMSAQPERAQSSDLNDEPFGILQEDIVTYLIGSHIQNVSSIEQLEQSKKLMASVIKKFIEDERILIVIADHNDVNQRVLALHPNFVA